jgi:D-alanyl-D-alanine carboxypeptidase
MRRDRSQSLPRISCALLGLVVFGLMTLSASDPADARARRHSHRERSESSYQPPSAAIVVDGNSGRVLHASNPDNLRHPASLTKIMTLYLLFEQLEAGQLKLDSRLSVSAHAAAQEPSKLGLEPGQSIEVDDAIKAVVTKSANDVAVVIAEAIGGNETDFAKLMTRKAHALGMTRTVYTNASGLPDDEQVTTARDQALLGRAIQDRFPRYYRYFATSTFRFHGMAIRNHNHLLGQVEGVDGIKTGYTRASGFNLVASLHRGNRHLVAAVFGGSSSGARDARMRGLIEQYIGQASTQRTVPLIAEAVDSEPVHAKIRPAALRSDKQVATASPAPKIRTDHIPAAASSMLPVAQGSAEPIQPIPVKTITVRPGTIQASALSPLVMAAPQASIVPYQLAATASAAASQPAPSRPAPDPATVAQGPAVAPSQPSSSSEASAPVSPPGPRPGVLGTLTLRTASAEGEPVVASLPAAAPVAPPPRAANQHGGWMIQLGAFADEAEAKQRLRAAQGMAHGLLANADAFTERVVRGSKELYRARFAGFDKEKAEAACHYFKRNDIACMTLKD